MLSVGRIQTPWGNILHFSTSPDLIALLLLKHLCQKIKLYIKDISDSHFPSKQSTFSTSPPKATRQKPQKLCHSIKHHHHTAHAILHCRPSLKQTRLSGVLSSAFLFLVPSFTKHPGQHFLWDSAQKTTGIPQGLLLTVIRTWATLIIKGNMTRSLFWFNKIIENYLMQGVQ